MRGCVFLASLGSEYDHVIDTVSFCCKNLSKRIGQILPDHNNFSYNHQVYNYCVGPDAAVRDQNAYC